MVQQFHLTNALLNKSNFTLMGRNFEVLYSPTKNSETLLLSLHPVIKT